MKTIQVFGFSSRDEILQKAPRLLRLLEAMDLNIVFETWFGKPENIPTGKRALVHVPKQTPAPHRDYLWACKKSGHILFCEDRGFDSNSCYTSFYSLEDDVKRLVETLPNE